VFLLVALFFFTGCRRDMHDQPKLKAYREGAARAPVAGTVARGQLREDLHFYTGKSAPDAQGKQSFEETFPFPVTRQVLDRGHERYNVSCSPCHGLIGDGEGMVVKRGFRHPPSLHIDRLRNAPVGYYFDVMTNGFGAMPDYATQIPPRDRWAIIAYIRALQLSQNIPAGQLPAGERAKLRGNQ
jgi:hypothetical protein